MGGEDEKISALSASENELVDQDDGFVAKGSKYEILFI